MPFLGPPLSDWTGIIRHSPREDPVGTQWETCGKNRQQGLGTKGFPQKKVLSLVLCVAIRRRSIRANPDTAAAQMKQRCVRVRDSSPYLSSGQKSLLASMSSSRICLATLAEGMVLESVSACQSFW